MAGEGLTGAGWKGRITRDLEDRMLAETIFSAVAAAGLGIAAITAYRKRFLSAARIAAYALVPLGLVMTGAVDWIADTAFSPVAWKWLRCPGRRLAALPVHPGGGAAPRRPQGDHRRDRAECRGSGGVVALACRHGEAAVRHDGRGLQRHRGDSEEARNLIASGDSRSRDPREGMNSPCCGACCGISRVRGAPSSPRDAGYLAGDRPRRPRCP